MNHVNTVYDYIVAIRATEKDGKFEEYRQTIQAYTMQDAMMAALVELNAEHGVTDRGCDIKILSVRPDTQKVGEQTRVLIEQLSAQVLGKLTS